MQTRAARGCPEENFGVLRAKRTVAGVGDFGAILVNRQATDGSGTFNRTYGFEANLAPARYLRIDSYLAGVDDDATGTDWAGRVWAGWRDPFWDVSASHQAGGRRLRAQGGLRAPSGCARGVRHGRACTPGPRPCAWLNEVNPFVEVDYVTDLDGRLLTRTTNAARWT